MPRIDAITLKQLRALAAIDQAGRLAAASETLNVTAPAVSIQLRSLEDHVGGQLVLRGPGGHTSLTEEGKVVLKAAHAIEQTLARCEEQVTALKEGKAGKVAIAVVSTGKYFAPGLIKKAQTAMPGIEFSLKIGNREQTRRALTEGAVDVAIMGRPPREPPSEVIPLGNHPYVLIAAPDHPLAKADSVGQSDLLDQLFLCREPGSGTRILTERFIDQVGDGYPVRTMELGSNETIKQGVMAGLGIAMISAHTIAHELQSGRIVTLKLPGLPIMRQWFLIRPMAEPPSYATLKFEEFLKQEAGAFLPYLPF